MPSSGSDDEGSFLVDTSVAVALVVADHEHHRATSEVLDRRALDTYRALDVDVVWVP